MSTHRRLQVDVVGNPAGFLAALNQMNLGTSRFQGNMQRANKEAGLFNKQLMAIGTTARYALAGQLVFGIVGAVQRLGDFKAQLGTIDAVAGEVDRRGHFHSIGSQLNQVGEDALLLSNKLGIATNDVESYMQRFFSSFQVPANVRMREMESFVERMGMLQRQFGAEAGDPQQLAGGVAGMIHNIPGGEKNIAANTTLIANLISNLVSKTPNITGRDIARDIGRIGATMNIARMTPQQAFAVWGLAGMSGGSSSVIGRGVAQLLGTSLLNPNTPAQTAAFSQAGLPTDPTTLRNMGGFRVLMKLMQFVAPGGGHIGNLAALNDEGLDDADAVRAARTSGINLTALYNLFGRQESVRQFVNLLGQGGVKALQDYIKAQQRATKADQQRERFNAANQQAMLQRFTEARKNLSLSLIGGLTFPLEQGLARPTLWASNLAARHPKATQIAMTSALGLSAASALGRLGVFGKVGKMGKFGRLLGMAGNVESAAIAEAIKKEELPAAIAGQVADGTRANPFWVIVSPLSRTVGGIPDGGFGPGGGPIPAPVPGKSNWWKRVVPIVPRAALFGDLAVAGAVLASAGGGYQGETGHLAFGAKRGKDGQIIIPPKLEGGHSYAQAGLGDLANPVLAALEASHQRMDQLQRIEVTGQAKTDLTLRLVDKDGRTIIVQEKKGVPTKIWGAKQVPTHKGKAGRRTKH